MSCSETHDVFVIVLFGTLMGALAVVAIAFMAPDVSGATVASTYNQSTTFPHQYTYAGSLDYVHTKDDYVATTYADSSGNLWVAYRETSNATWTYHMVAAYDDLHTGPWEAWGMVATSNGSVCIGAATSQGGTYQNRLYLWSKFPAVGWDTWDYEPICTSTWHYRGTLGINNTDVIMYLIKYGGAGPFDMYYETFDFANYTLGHALGAGHDTTLNPTNVIRVMANTSGYFHMIYRDGSGVDRYRQWDSGPNNAIDPSSAYQVHDAWFLPNDMLVACGGTSSGHRYWWYQTTYFGAFTRHQISTDSSTWSYGTALAAIGGLGDDYTVRVVAFNDAAGDKKAYTWSAAWNASEVAWQNSVQEADIADPDYVRMVGGCKHMWPRDDEGRMWAMPTDGWTIMGWDEDGATDEHKIYTNGTLFWADLTTSPPNITTVSLPSGTYDTPYSHTLTKSGGTSPYVWSLLIGPGWLSINTTTGELYGTPTDTGTFTVKVQLADAIPRYDNATWSLTVEPGEYTIGGETWATWWGPTCLSGAVLGAIIVAIFVWGAINVATRR